MPIYEYECPNCGERTTKMRKVSERNEYVGCYFCNNPRGECSVGMKRVITPVHGRVDSPADGSRPAHRPGGDQFTADTLGVSKKELMTNPALSGLREKGVGEI